ncbi:cupin domain-containing protein [Natrinema sp. 1APR25-10V2]|nr:cupin domain-containing protein [Natrinema sp. 1APR25-10V2]
MGEATGSGAEDEAAAEESDVDEPEGFSAEVLAPHATFPDEVAASFGIDFERDGEETVSLSDASNVVVAKFTVEPGGTSGWHAHPGPVIVNVAEGEAEITFSDDCVTHTYTAGEAFIDSGNHAEKATNPSETERAVLLATFIGVPDGEPPTEWVEPPDC